MSDLKIFSNKLSVDNKRIIVRLDLNVPIKNSKIESKTSWILKSIRKYNPYWKLKNPDYHKDYFCVTKNAVRLILTRPACDLPTPGSD